jgi:phosphoribosylformylglycinamidine synthase
MIHRIDVQTAGEDSIGRSVRQQIMEMGHAVGTVAAVRIFLVDSDMDQTQARRVADGLLADPIVESAQLMLQPPDDGGRSRIEIHLKPGVMDPVAASTEMAIADMGIPLRQVRTGRAFLIEGKLDQPQLQRIAAGALANGVIESVHFEAFHPDHFETGSRQPLQLRHVSLRQLTERPNASRRTSNLKHWLRPGANTVFTKRSEAPSRSPAAPAPRAGTRI